MVEESNDNSRPIDLERSELRYIFYANDQEDLIRDFGNLGFDVVIYPNTPITRTVYFGSKRGVKPGLSIKARIYSSTKIENIWKIESKTEFNLLEIKSTVHPEEFMAYGAMPYDVNSVKLLKNRSLTKQSKDIIFRVQQASSDGLLGGSALKSKSRLTEHDINEVHAENTDIIDTKLNFKQIIKLLTKQTKVDKKLSSDLTDLLNEKIRSDFQEDLFPIVMTQYSRIHLIPKDTTWKKSIRITIDPGVEYYALKYHDEDFIHNPLTIAQYITRENFSRLEFKIDPKLLNQNEELATEISDILVSYGCVAYLSKKWTGVTLVSERHIKNQPFWREHINKHISGYFPIEISWFEYGTISEDFYDLIRKSKFIDPYEDNPKILVKNENFVTGYLGVPVPSLMVKVEGPEISYHIPPESYPVRLEDNTPDFYITEEEELPIRSTTITSKEELNLTLLDSISIVGDTYFRSFGFLVKSKRSDRVYKLTIERKLEFIQGKKKPTSQIYCKMRYIGSINKLHKPNPHDIHIDLENFYKEFVPVLARPLNHKSEKEREITI
jgi:hypothetical protein